MLNFEQQESQFEVEVFEALTACSLDIGLLTQLECHLVFHLKLRIVLQEVVKKLLLNLAPCCNWRKLGWNLHCTECCSWLSDLLCGKWCWSLGRLLYYLGTLMLSRCGTLVCRFPIVVYIPVEFNIYYLNLYFWWYKRCLRNKFNLDQKNVVFANKTYIACTFRWLDRPVLGCGFPDISQNFFCVV